MGSSTLLSRPNANKKKLCQRVGRRMGGERGGRGARGRREEGKRTLLARTSISAVVLLLTSMTFVVAFRGVRNPSSLLLVVPPARGLLLLLLGGVGVGGLLGRVVSFRPKGGRGTGQREGGASGRGREGRGTELGFVLHAVCREK